MTHQIVRFLIVFAIVWSTSGVCGRTASTAPISWQMNGDMAQGWPAGNVYFGRTIRFDLKNVSDVEQNVAVTADVNAGFITNINVNREQNIYIHSSVALIDQNFSPYQTALGTQMSTGKIRLPSSGVLTIPSGEVGSFVFQVQYAGPVPKSIVWMFGTMHLVIEIGEDRGAIVGSSIQNAGNTNGAVLRENSHANSATAVIFSPILGGRPF